MVLSTVWKSLKFKESLLIQKSRQKRINKGDSKAKYFHSFMKTRLRRNNIISLATSIGRFEKVEEVKLEVKYYFERFQETNSTYQFLMVYNLNNYQRMRESVWRHHYLMTKLKKLCGQVMETRIIGQMGSTLIFSRLVVKL